MSSLIDSSALEKRALAKVTRYLLLYIVVGQFFVQLDRNNISFAKAAMSADLALNAEAYGFAFSILAIGTLFAQLPSGVAFQKFGARRWLTTLMISWGVVVMAQAFVTHAYALYITRFLIGALEAGFVPGILVLVSQWFRGNSHGKMIAGIQLGAATAGILGGPLAGAILDNAQIGMANWRSLYLIEGVLTIAWAFLALKILHDDPLKTPWLKPDEREFMSRHLAEYQAQKLAEGAVEKSGFWDALKDVRILALMLAWALAGWISSIMAGFMPELLRTASGATTNQAVGNLSMVPFIIMAIVAFTWGKHADRTERHWHCVIPLLVSAAGFLLYPLATNAAVALIAMALVRAGATGFFVTFWPTAHMLVGKHTIIKTTALIETANQLGNFFGPWFFGKAQDVTGSTTVGIYVCVGVLLINFVIMNTFFFTHKARQRHATAAGATT